MDELADLVVEELGLALVALALPHCLGLLEVDCHLAQMELLSFLQEPEVLFLLCLASLFEGEHALIGSLELPGLALVSLRANGRGQPR